MVLSTNMIATEGYLSKWTNVMKGWQRRWLVLDDNTGILSYYVSREKMKKGLRRGCIPLKRAVVGIDNEDETTFTVTSHLKIYHFQAQNITERNEWVSKIEDTILRHAYGTRHKSISFEHLMKPHSTIDDFNKRLLEADSYLQMVIENSKAVSSKMNSLQVLKNQAMCSMLTTYANNFLDEVKHTIILLQIAKNTMDPDNLTLPLMENEDTVKHAIEVADANLIALKSGSQQTVKAAYSTSDDESFFDARETISNSNTSSCSSGEDSPNSEPGNVSMHGEIDSSPEVPSSKSKQNQLSDSESEDGTCTEGVMVTSLEQKKSLCCVENLITARADIMMVDGMVNYDYIHDHSEESEISIECSVVSHLISQVKIGMDLSKVVLPIFILEKRSLLEMYADFFAHPDEFVAITDQPDAKGRMVQLVKWYLSSFHAARKSEVAKKPYNPILGEIFLCSWDIESDFKCTTDKLSFAAEQVSHHPPISAFYAECPTKRISCSSYIWTKSKFYGLSIGVLNEGGAFVNVFDYNEVYSVTFPNAYGRSILTKPWLELGGNVRIACEKTGFVANIEFLTKPFYGTKRHKIVGSILEPGATKGFVTLEGEWSGKIYARWLNGEAELFSNVNEMRVFKKNVRSVYEQDDFESRRIWKDVTAGLWLNDISRATNAKIEIESRQRLEAQSRTENGQEWAPRLFSPTSNGNWVFKRPFHKFYDK